MSARSDLPNEKNVGDQGLDTLMGFPGRKGPIAEKLDLSLSRKKSENYHKYVTIYL